MDLISIIIPTYNGEKFLENALKSIEEQQDANIEVILLDDGSTDRTLEIAYNYKDRLPLSIKEIPHSGSWTSNSNLGVSLAKGRFINFLHQDDYWMPGRLSKIRTVLQANPEVDVVLHPSRYVATNQRPLCVINCPFSKSGRLDSLALFEKLYVQNFIMMPAPLFSRDIFQKAGGFDSSLWYTADWKLWLSLAKLGKWYYLKEPLACFRLHLTSQTVRSSNSSDDFRAQHQKVLDHFASEMQRIPTETPARCSAELNVALASYFHHRSVDYSTLLSCIKKLRPKSTWQLLRYSRLHERVGARLLCGLYGSKDTAADPH